jgi:hypothetical protein
MLEQRVETLEEWDVECWSVGGGVREWRYDGMGNSWGSYVRLVG